MGDFENRASTSSANIWANLLVWVGLISLVVAIGAIRKWPKYSLYKHWAIARGHVSQEQPQAHGSFYFIYVVDHKVYTSIGHPLPNLDRTRVGDPLTVYYDRRQPENCTLGQPDVDLVLSAAGIVAQCAVIPLIVMIFLHHFRLLPPWNLFKIIRLT